MISHAEFYRVGPVAVFGVSAARRGFGVAAYKELKKAGIETFALNPKGGQLDGVPIYAKMADLPAHPQAAVILTREAGALQAVEECKSNGVRWVWLQGGSDTPAVRQRCFDLSLEFLRGQCVLMHLGGFPHSLHRFFHDLFTHSRSS
jgi:predicted CoA-binding protein